MQNLLEEYGAVIESVAVIIALCGLIIKFFYGPACTFFSNILLRTI